MARLPLVGSPEMRPDHPDSVVTPWVVDADEDGPVAVQGVRVHQAADVEQARVGHALHPGAHGVLGNSELLGDGLEGFAAVAELPDDGQVGRIDLHGAFDSSRTLLKQPQQPPRFRELLFGRHGGGPSSWDYDLILTATAEKAVPKNIPAFCGSCQCKITFVVGSSKTHVKK
jgi:hypothetical protein